MSGLSRSQFLFVQHLHIKIEPFKLTRREVLIDRLLYDPEVAEAAIAAGEAVPMPVRFRVTMPDPPPNAQSIEYGHMWSRGPTETDVENIVDPKMERT